MTGVPELDAASGGPGPPGRGTEAPILEVEGVDRTFPLPRRSLLGPRPSLHAVRDVSLRLYPGERVGIVGESGSGKTTLARLLVALDRPQRGRIRFRGQDITGLGEPALREFRRHCQIVFQDPVGSLDPRMKVRTIVTEPLRALSVEGDHEERLHELLRAVGLSRDAADRYPHEFSGGQRQRIAIARALAPHPRILVADELVSALDVSVRAQILNLLFDLCESYDLTVLLISHDLSVVHRVCDRVAVMYRGSIVEEGPTGRLFTAPQHPYTQALLRAIPTLGSGLPEAPPPGRASASAIERPSGCSYTGRCPLVHDRCHLETPALRGPGGRDGASEQRAACHVAFTPGSDEHTAGTAR